MERFERKEEIEGRREGEAVLRRREGEGHRRVEKGREERRGMSFKLKERM